MASNNSRLHLSLHLIGHIAFATEGGNSLQRRRCILRGGGTPPSLAFMIRKGENRPGLL